MQEDCSERKPGNVDCQVGRGRIYSVRNKSHVHIRPEFVRMKRRNYSRKSIAAE